MGHHKCVFERDYMCECVRKMGTLVIIEIFADQSGVLKRAESASFGSLLEMKNLRPHLSLIESESSF